MKKEIWVFAELSEGKPISVCEELNAKAHELAEKIGGCEICYVALGNKIAGSESLLHAPVDKVYVADHQALEHYQCSSYTEILGKMIEKYQPEMFFIGATALGAELAPSVALKAKTGLAAHCVDLCWDGKRVNCMVPAFGGKVVSEIYIPKTKPIMASVRPGILPHPEQEQSTVAACVMVDTSCLDGFTAKETFVSFVPETGTGKALEDASVVVCAGGGAASEKTWEKLQKLADLLDAGLGYTRSLADQRLNGDESNMIGASGKSVKPELYLGFGVSGASHHTCGMNKSRTVISINKDSRAKMFGESDYGVVADADKMVTELLKLLS